jgi:hypothetical protein
LFDHLENAWPDMKRSSLGTKPLSAFLLSMSSRTIDSTTRDTTEDTALTSQIRRLVATDVLHDVQSSPDDRGLLSRTRELTVEDILDQTCTPGSETNETKAWSLLGVFLSPSWLNSSKSHIQNDVASLIGLITSDQPASCSMRDQRWEQV